MEKLLFLHWGPGGNAQVELNQLNMRFPASFEAWNQPLLNPIPNHPYSAILDQTLEKISKAFQEAKGPIALVGHSFGAQLALDAAQILPEKISKLYLIGALTSVHEGYVRFGYHLAKIYHDEKIKVANDRFAQKSSFAHFALLVEAITAHADFMNHYWGTSAASLQAKTAFFKQAENTPILNLELYMAVMKDLLETDVLTAPFKMPSCPVQIDLGNEDPYFDPQQAKQDWQKKIPHAQIHIHHAGHFVHLESNIEWT